MKKVVSINPEFGVELTLALPYIYWLHQNNQLEKVITSKDMKPFYYFSDDVEERFEYRTIDNGAAGMDEIPNNWIYGMKNNAELYKDEWEHWKSFNDVEKGCGILDYRKWELPNYTEHYKNDEIVFDKPIVVISNRYNWEHGSPPLTFFDIGCLYNLFNYLTESGYTVIYKRPDNTEFPLDQNEINTKASNVKLTANVEGIGLINDYQLTNYYEDVHLMDDVRKKYPHYSYNEFQVRLFANTNSFICMGGGSTLLACLFQKPTIGFWGRKMEESTRLKFWEDENKNKNIKNYHYMLNPNLVPFVDLEGDDMLNDGYKKFIALVEETIK
tara:strand:+ start:3508 stop:4491 length:984 start_codon:yes stop_codon:yes gene_type:complete